jgi:hypothetical protein
MNLEFTWLLPWGVALTIFLLSWGLTLWSYLRPGFTSIRWFRPLVLALRWFSILVLVLLLSAPVVSWLSHWGKKPVIAVLVDSSASMGLGEGENRLSQVLELTQNILKDEALLKKANLSFYSFSSSISPLSPAQLNGEEPIVPTGSTHLLASLQELTGLYAPDQLAGVLVLTDGRQSADAPFLQNSDFSIPIKYVIIGNSPQRDASIASLQIEENLLAGSKSLCKVGLRLLGMASQTITVTLYQNQEALAEKTIVPQTDQETTTIDLPFTPKSEEGLFRVLVTSATPDEIPQNDEKFSVSKVVSHRIKVLLVSSSPSPDYAFLKRAMENDSALDLATICYVGDKILPEGGNTTTPPVAYPELDNYDVLILLNPRESTGAEIYPLLQEYVRGGGGLLTIFTSDQTYPAELKTLSPLLPAPGGAVEFHPLSASPASLLAPGAGWIPQDNLTLPPLSGPRIIESGADSIPLVVRQSDGQVVEAVSQKGFGRVLALGMGGFWGWEMSGCQLLYPTLFGRAVRFLAEPHLSGPFVLEVQSGSGPGETVNMRILCKNPAEIGTGATVTISHISDESQNIVLSQEFNPSAKSFHLQFVPREAGVYNIVVRGANGGESSRLFMCAPANELSDPRPDEGFLSALAGEENRLTPENVFAGLLSLTENFQPQATLESLQLANNPWTYLLVALFLGIEWLIRRRWGAW